LRELVQSACLLSDFDIPGFRPLPFSLSGAPNARYRLMFPAFPAFPQSVPTAPAEFTRP